jgi:putative transcriptional regulator
MSKAAVSLSQEDRNLSGTDEVVRYAKGTPRSCLSRACSGDVNVKAIRTKLGMTQQTFAARFGFSINTLRHWEQGKREPEGPRDAASDRTPSERVTGG